MRLAGPDRRYLGGEGVEGVDRVAGYPKLDLLSRDRAGQRRPLGDGELVREGAELRLAGHQLDGRREKVERCAFLSMVLRERARERGPVQGEVPVLEDQA